MTEIEKAIEILIDIKNGIGCYTRNYEKFYSDDEKKQIKALEMAISALQENPKLIKEVKKWKTYFEEELSNKW